MKKTVIVNISGMIFHIDEDAYGKLSDYINALHQYFDPQPEGKEIVSDIESRIAELLQPRIKEGKQSISMEDIEEIISILGRPQDIAGSDEEISGSAKKETNPTYTSASSRTYPRKLYRDPDNSVLGGVCSGLAAYFAIDPLLFRLIFIALCFAGGASFFIYAILWIAVPQAHTVAQKLEMRGEEVNINNIGRTYQHTGYDGSSSFWHKGKSIIERFFMLLGDIFRAIGRIIAVIFGIGLILVSLTIIISFISVAFFNNVFISELVNNQSVSLLEFLSPVIYPANTVVLLIILLIIVIIPLIGLIYAGLKILIRFKANDKWAILSLTVLWIIAVIFSVILILDQGGNFRHGNSCKETIALTSPMNNVIYLKTSSPYHNEHNMLLGMSSCNWYGIQFKDGTKELYGVNRIDIRKGTAACPELEIIREARGETYDDALKAAQQIEVGYTQTDSVLNIESIFRLASSDSWRFQTATIVLKVPVGMRVVFENRIPDRLFIHRPYKRWTQEKTWEMGEDGWLVPFSREQPASKEKRVFLKSLTIKAGHMKGVKEEDIKMLQNSNKKMFLDTDSGQITYGVPVLSFRATSNGMISVNVNEVPNRNERKYMQKRNSKSGIKYNFTMKDSVLYLDPLWFFRGKYIDKQPVNVTVYIPAGTKIFFSSQLNCLLKPADQYLVNHTWRIRSNGFSEIDKKYFLE